MIRVFELVRALAAYFTSDVADTKIWLRKAAAPDASRRGIHAAARRGLSIIWVCGMTHVRCWKELQRNHRRRRR